MLRKRKRHPSHHAPKHHRAKPFNFASGMVYAGAVILSMALGGLFYKGYRDAQKAQLEQAQPGEPATSSPLLPPGARVLKKIEKGSGAPRRAPSAPAPAAPAPQAPPAEGPAPAAPEPSEPPSPAETSAPPAAPAAPAAAAPAAGGTPSIRLPARKPWEPVLVDQLGLQKTKLMASADTCVMANPAGQREMNGGALAELPLKGNDSFILARYDADAIRNWTVTRATWHGKVLRGRVRALGFSTTTAPWEEGSGTLKEPASSGATFGWANAKTKPWRDDGAPLPYAIRGNGQSLMSAGIPQEAQDTADSWVAVPIDPVVVQALVCGAASGLVISDEKGQTEGTIVIAARDDTNSTHYIEVEGALLDMVPPSRVTELKATAHPALERRNSRGALLTWVAGGDDARNGQAFKYEIRYGLAPMDFERATEWPPGRTPWPQPSGQPDGVIIEDLEPDATYAFFVRSVDEAAQPSSIAETTLKIPPLSERAETTAPPSYEAGPIDLTPGVLGFFAADETAGIDPLTGAVAEEAGSGPRAAPGSSRLWDRSTRTLHLRAAQNETVGFLLALQRKGAELPTVRIALDPFRSLDNTLDSAGLRLARTWYSYAPSRKSGTVWRGDALIPFDDRFSVRSPSNIVPGLAFPSVHAELHVPADSKPGTYRSLMTVTAGEGIGSKVNVLLEVLPIRLPDQPRFTVELVTPCVVAMLYRKDIQKREEAFPVEQEYQRLARSHRCALAFMPYLRNGACSSAFLPAVGGKGANWEVSDWEPWDARFAGYLSGAAFEGLAGGTQPVSHIILPLYESWPTPLQAGYGCAGQEEMPAVGNFRVYVGPSEDIYNCMNSDYWRTLRAAINQFGFHFSARNWLTTKACVWLANWPIPNFQGKPPPWWLGAPRYRDDFLALEAFAQVALASAAAWPPGQLVFRASVPGADTLARYGEERFGLLTVSDTEPASWRLLRDRAAVHGTTLWLESDTVPLEDTTLEIVTTALKYFLEGADGWSLREVTGQPAHWLRSQASSVVYCGAPAGVSGPLPSLRLKALQRAEQDIEYLLLLQDKKGWSRQRLRDFVIDTVPSLARAPALTCDELFRLRFAVQEVLRTD